MSHRLLPAHLALAALAIPAHSLAQLPIGITLRSIPAPLENPTPRSEGAYNHVVWGRGLTRSDVQMIAEHAMANPGQITADSAMGTSMWMNESPPTTLLSLAGFEAKTKSFPLGSVHYMPSAASGPHDLDVFFSSQEGPLHVNDPVPGWTISEVWDYRSGEGFVKTVAAMSPVYAGFDRDGELMGRAPRGIVNCTQSSRPAKVRDILNTWEVVYQVQLFDPYKLSREELTVQDFELSAMSHTGFPIPARRELIARMFTDVANGRIQARAYMLGLNIHSLPKDRHRVTETKWVTQYDDLGEVIGRKEMEVSNIIVGDELGAILTKDSLRSFLVENVSYLEFDDYGEIIGDRFIEIPRAVDDLDGFIFHETWSLVSDCACIQKTVRGIAPTVLQYDPNGNPVLPSPPLGVFLEFE